MGKAWEAFKNLADKEVVIKVGGDSLPYWVWVLIALLLFILYVAFNFLIGYRQGLRGCDLAIFILTALFVAMGKLMARGSGHQRAHNQSASTTGRSGSTLL